ncbi:MAG: hypothetical protein KF696_08745 [Planctomycetes bacterium]|nr:hypothetical protein [Planctomycetota bacterium]MCW8136685.1 hypothetical protein [Planctomycetota bacterium]
MLNDRERQELLGGLRELHWRAPLALLSALLLVACGDHFALWPLCWVALVPLAFACRGAGPVAALLLAWACLAPASIVNTLWLLDTDASPLMPWLLAGVPALAAASAEMPIARIVPRIVRALMAGALLAGWYALLPHDFAYLVPLGTLIDSGIVTVAYPKLGLATVAGILFALAWTCAEWHGAAPADLKVRPRWPGLVMAAVLAVVAVADWAGAPRAEPGDQPLSVWIVPEAESAERDSAVLLGEDGHGGVMLWAALPEPGAARLERHLWAAGRIAETRALTLVALARWPDRTEAWVFHRDRAHRFHHEWPAGNTEPLVLEGTGNLSVAPTHDLPETWSLRNDMQLLASPEQPHHESQLNWWLREQRRSALIRGTRRLVVWQGGGAAIDAQGRLAAVSKDGRAIAARLAGGERHGEAFGRERLRVWEIIASFCAPVLLLMLIGVSGVRWAKLRYRARTAEVAIEEVDNDETSLTPEQKDKITRVRRKPQD